MSDSSKRPLEERFYLYERQVVTVDDFPSSGHILDIGGGGEGIIGLLKGQDVIAIDMNRRELEEAGEGALNVVMDPGICSSSMERSIPQPRSSR